MKVVLMLSMLVVLNGCVATAVGTAVGTVVDVGIEVVKVPFKVGGAIIDGVSGDDQEEQDAGDQESEQSDN